MSSIRVRSYLDENAPQFDGQDKRAFINFMKAMFESPSYNEKVTANITVNLSDKTISIPTSGSPGFSVGNLIKISGTLSATFQSTFYRVVEASDGFAYFFNKPSTYLYHVIAEDVKRTVCKYCCF